MRSQSITILRRFLGSDRCSLNRAHLTQSKVLKAYHSRCLFLSATLNSVACFILTPFGDLFNRACIPITVLLSFPSFSFAFPSSKLPELLFDYQSPSLELLFEIRSDLSSVCVSLEAHLRITKAVRLPPFRSDSRHLLLL